MLKTIGHHVCKNQGNANEIERKGYPIALASDNSFLGKGYYFWDYNIDEAKHWGHSHYNNRYYIFQADINCEENVMFDLVGNRRHMAHLIKLMNRFEDENPQSGDWDLGVFFDFLFEILREEEELKPLFPFKIIRAVDHSERKNELLYHFDKNISKDRYILLNPRILISVLECSQQTITNFKLLETKR